MTRLEKRLKDEEITIADIAKVEEKECNKCRQTKKAEDFGLLIKTGTSIAYLHSWCRECRQVRARENAKQRRERKCFGKEYSRKTACRSCAEVNRCAEAWGNPVWNTIDLVN
jgi:hypothetical protein